MSLGAIVLGLRILRGSEEAHSRDSRAAVTLQAQVKTVYRNSVRIRTAPRCSLPTARHPLCGSSFILQKNAGQGSEAVPGLICPCPLRPAFQSTSRGAQQQDGGRFPCLLYHLRAASLSDHSLPGKPGWEPQARPLLAVCGIRPILSHLGLLVSANPLPGTLSHVIFLLVL